MVYLLAARLRLYCCKQCHLVHSSWLGRQEGALKLGEELKRQRGEAIQLAALHGRHERLPVEIK